MGPAAQAKEARELSAARHQKPAFDLKEMAKNFVHLDTLEEGKSLWKEADRFLPMDRFIARSVVVMGVAVSVVDVGLNFVGGAAEKGGAKIAEEVAKVVVEAAAKDGAVATVEKGITFTEKELGHVFERHSSEGLENLGKSIFSSKEDLRELVRAAQKIDPVKQLKGRNFERIIDAGRNIGVDRLTGKPTSMYTVITDAAGNLVTAFPGHP